MTFPVAILAGGLATRLRPLTVSIPKVLVDVAGKPFAVRQIELLRQHGLNEIVFCLGHLGEQVEATLGNGEDFGVEIKYVFDGEHPLGTGGALRRALPLLGESFLVLYGDSYLDCDYGEVIRAFRASGKQALMTVFRNAGQWDTSNVSFQNGQIQRYDKRLRSSEMEHIDYGLGVLQSCAIKEYPPDKSLDLAEIYQDLLAKDQLAGFEVKQRFYEIGSLAGLDETRRFFKERCKGNDLHTASPQ